MNEYFEDYDNYDQVANELKDSLISSVKNDIKNKIQSLENENAELKERQKNLSLLEAKAIEEIRKTEQERNLAINKAKFIKAKELFKELSETKYLISYEYYSKDKCNKCDKDRNISFEYPSGKQGLEKCQECGLHLSRAVVAEAIGDSASVRRGELIVWYYPYKGNRDGDDDFGISAEVKKPYNNQPYEELDKYRVIFDSKEEAQNYANYLNTRTNG